MWNEPTRKKTVDEIVREMKGNTLREPAMELARAIRDEWNEKGNCGYLRALEERLAVWVRGEQANRAPYFCDWQDLRFFLAVSILYEEEVLRQNSDLWDDAVPGLYLPLAGKLRPVRWRDLGSLALPLDRLFLDGGRTAYGLKITGVLRTLQGDTLARACRDQEAELTRLQTELDRERQNSREQARQLEALNSAEAVAARYAGLQAEEARSRAIAQGQAEADRLIEEANRRADAVLEDTRRRADELLEGAQYQADSIFETARRQAAELEAQAVEQARARAQQAADRYLRREQAALREQWLTRDAVTPEQAAENGRLLRSVHDDMADRASELQRGMNRLLEDMNTIRCEMEHRLGDWRGELYRREYAALAETWCELYRLGTRTDRQIREALLELDGTEEPTPLLTALNSQKNGLDKVRKRLEQAMGQLGLYLFTPQPGEGYNSEWHAETVASADQVEEGMPIRECRMPGIGIYDSRQQELRCLKQAAVAVEGVCDNE